MRTPGERFFEALRTASEHEGLPTLTILWCELAPESRSKYERAAARLALVAPSGQAVYEAWRKRADTSGRVILRWEELPSDQRLIWDGVAKDMLAAKPARADGYYWVRGKDPQWPGVFVDRWTQDASSPGGGFWRDMGTNEVEVLAGPLESPNGAS